MSDIELKTQICDALAAWIRQRPGFGQENTSSSDRRGVARDKRDAETLLTAVRLTTAISADDLIEAAKRAFSGRLEIQHVPSMVTDNKVHIEYTTGQYWPTEYRAAAAAVCASALWSAVRTHMPPADGKLTRTHGVFTTEHDNVEGKTPGDWLRSHFRKMYGSALQRRWFN